MVNGLVHIYTGNGKGKTTASIGLSIRAVGAGKRVLLVQFMKGMETSEINPLKKLGIEVVRRETIKKFIFAMTQEEKELYKADNEACFQYAKEHSNDFELIVFDEAVSAISEGMIDENDMISFIKNKPRHLEIVLTGRQPSDELMQCADYLSEIVMRKHPYERGIGARMGIEF